MSEGAWYLYRLTAISQRLSSYGNSSLIPFERQPPLSTVQPFLSLTFLLVCGRRGGVSVALKLTYHAWCLTSLGEMFAGSGVSTHSNPRQPGSNVKLSRPVARWPHKSEDQNNCPLNVSLQFHTAELELPYQKAFAQIVLTLYVALWRN